MTNDNWMKNGARLSMEASRAKQPEQTEQVELRRRAELLRWAELKPLRWAKLLRQAEPLRRAKAEYQGNTIRWGKPNSSHTLVHKKDLNALELISAWT